MKKSFLLSLLAICGLSFMLSAGEAEKTGRKAVDFFIDAPKEIASGLSRLSRLDMVDYFNNGLAVKSENELGCKMSIRSIDDNMIVWQDDDSIRTTIVMLPEEGSRPDTVIMVIRTFLSPVPDSSVKYFIDRGDSWARLSDKPFPSPKLKDWIRPEARRSEKSIDEVLPFMLVLTEFDPATNTLVFIDRSREYYADGEVPDELSMLLPELRYEWRGNRFHIVRR